MMVLPCHKMLRGTDCMDYYQSLCSGSVVTIITVAHTRGGGCNCHWVRPHLPCPRPICSQLGFYQWSSPRTQSAAAGARRWAHGARGTARGHEQTPAKAPAHISSHIVSVVCLFCRRRCCWRATEQNTHAHTHRRGCALWINGSSSSSLLCWSPACARKLQLPPQPYPHTHTHNHTQANQTQPTTITSSC
jgi:hypothetical protein